MATFSIGQFYFTFCLFCASRINKREKVYSSLTPLINLRPPGVTQHLAECHLAESTWMHWQGIMQSGACLLNKSSSWARALGVTKIKYVKEVIWLHVVVILRSDLDVQQTHLWSELVEQSSCLARALSVTKITIFQDKKYMGIIYECS
jgi:hypothetical protein